MKQFKYFVAALAIAITAGALAQQSGGFPSQPHFLNVGINGQPGFGSFTYFGASSATSATGMVGVANTASGMCGSPAVAGDFCIRSTSGRILASTNNGASSADLSPLDSGAITWSFTTAQNPNCSAGGTNATVQLRKRGPLVTLSVTSFGTCATAGATVFTTNNAPVPAAFRPATSAGGCGVIEGGNAAGNAIVAVCVNTAGNFTVSNPAGSTTLIQIASQMSTTYSLD